MTTPNSKLVEILQPAYLPCRGFKEGCNGIATWAPAEGHVPRGFVGATGRLDEVKVVILLAEPGDPHGVEVYRGGNYMEQACEYTFKALSEGTDLFHRNLKYLLNRLFPDLPLRDQLRRAWVTETYPVFPRIGSLQAQRAIQTRWWHHSQVLQGQAIVWHDSRVQFSAYFHSLTRH